MIKPLLFVVAVGAGIGFLLPTGHPAAPASPARASAPAATPAPSAPTSSSFSTEVPQETMLERRSNGHFYVDANVNGHTIPFVVDTGATIVALTLDDARRAGVSFDPAAFRPVGRGASGDVYGEDVMIDVIDIDGKRVPQVRAIVAQDLDVSLLGQSYLSRISAVEMKGDYMRLR